MTRTEDQWIEEYVKSGAFWTHDGNVKRPHVKLRAGEHSGGFFYSKILIPDTPLMKDAASDLLEDFFTNYDGTPVIQIDGVVGPATGATRLARLLAEDLNTQGYTCFTASPSKLVAGERRSMVFSETEQVLLHNSTVLLCEDVTTTGLSTEMTVEAITKAGGRVLPFVLCMVNRSEHTVIKGRTIVSLIHRHLPKWNPEKNEKCPYCAMGSVAIDAKEPPTNWDLLTAEY